MIFSRISSGLPRDMLISRAIANKALFLDPNKVKSTQSLELAYYLAKSRSSDKKNIASNFHLEFLLWLAGKKDISSAINEMIFSNNEDILVISFEGDLKHKRILKEINAKTNGIAINQQSDSQELERIALSRVQN